MRRLKQANLRRSRYAEGQARPVEDAHALFESEYRQQYRSLPFWKRSVILLAGIAVNLLFAMLVFVVLFSVIGFDVRMQSGEVTHMTVDPGRAIVAGFTYIGMVVQAVGCSTLQRRHKRCPIRLRWWASP